MLRHRFLRWLFCPIGLILWLASGAAGLRAQRSVTLEVNSTNGSQIRVAWQSRSAVPAPGLQIFPDYQVHTSTDLTNWAPTGEKVAGTVGGTNRTFSIASEGGVDGMAFFRVESLIELPGAELIGERLDAADFS